jgi:hypothetical protein
MDLIGQVMSQPPYKDAPRVFVIVDNGSDHRGQAAVRRLHDAWPNAIMIHTPVHASWLNQAEINRPSGVSAKLRACPETQVGCSWCDWLRRERRRLMTMIIDQ